MCCDAFTPPCNKITLGPPAQTPKADPRAVGGHDRSCRNNLCFVSHDGLDAIPMTNQLFD
jgi:hypothetical protein